MEHIQCQFGSRSENRFIRIPRPNKLKAVTKK